MLELNHSLHFFNSTKAGGNPFNENILPHGSMQIKKSRKGKHGKLHKTWV